MQQELTKLAETLRAGQIKSKQGSYERRAPAKRARPLLREARRGLRSYVADHPDDPDALRLLSQAEEALLDYRNARLALERLLNLSPTRDKRDLKKLALLREYEGRWRDLGLSPEELAGLGRHLSSCLRTAPCDHSYRHTEGWLRAAHVDAPDKVIRSLERQGGYCDCEVSYNVVQR